MRAALKKASQSGGIQVGLLLAIFASVIMVTAVTYDSEVQNQPWQQTVTPGQLKKLREELPGLDRAGFVEAIKNLVKNDAYDSDGLESDLATLTDADFEALKAGIVEKLEGNDYGQMVAELSQMLNGHGNPRKTPTAVVTATPATTATESPYLFQMVTPTPIPTSTPGAPGGCAWNPGSCSPIVRCVCDANSKTSVSASLVKCYSNCEDFASAFKAVQSNCKTDVTYVWKDGSTGDGNELGPGTHWVQASYNQYGVPHDEDHKSCEKIQTDISVIYITEIKVNGNTSSGSYVTCANPGWISMKAEFSGTPTGIGMDWINAPDGSVTAGATIAIPTNKGGHWSVGVKCQGCTSAAKTVELYIIKVEVTPKNKVDCVGEGDIQYGLSADSYPLDAELKWTLTPIGSPGDAHPTTPSEGNRFAVNPGTIGGAYTVEAKASVMGSECSDQTSLKVVEVESLKPSEQNPIGDPSTNTHVVCKAASGTVTVTAKPYPDVMESELPGCWRLLSSAGVDGTGDLVRTINKALTGKRYIECVSGTSHKSATVYVVDTVPSPNVEVVCVGSGEITYTAAGAEYLPSGTLAWELVAIERGGDTTLSDNGNGTATVSVGMLGGKYSVKAACGACTGQAALTIECVEIDGSTLPKGVVVSGPTVSIGLTSASWVSGNVVWTVEPDNSANGGATIVGDKAGAVFTPGSVPGKYTIKAETDSGAGCQDIVDIWVVQVDLKEVSFGGTKYHTVKKDDGSLNYAAPHWLDKSSPPDRDANDPDDREYPICFERGTKCARPC